ncbi:hypothetical protein BH11MYX3_BH11MYX3_32290 [soil metagenome]
MANLLLAPARARHVYAVAALVGLVTFVIVFGPGHLLGTNAYWQMPEQDERMALMGYRYFLHEGWHWPLFISDAINVPYPKSVAFLDCIPIWALANKAVATIIPRWDSFSSDAYLGLWHGLAYALQAVFGVACLRALGHRSWRSGLIAIVFFLALPTWIFRYSHPALSAHWVLLWALVLYLRTPVGVATPRTLSIAKLCQLALAALVSPYQAALSLTVFIPSVLRSKHRRTIAIWLPVGIACVGLATWFAGYFAAETLRKQWGFEEESANLLGWLIPQHSGLVGDAQWIASANGTAWQYEGYAYLGLGLLGLLALFLPRLRILRGVIRRHPFLFAVVVGSAVFALSNHVYVGSHEILSFPIPRPLRWFASQFRSPGRFVWVPTYVLMVFLLHGALTRFTTWRGFALVALAALIQLVDATGEWSRVRGMTSGPTVAVLHQDAWRPLVHGHDEVVILPPYSCVVDDDAVRLDRMSMEIQMLASEWAIPINGTYSARDMRRCEAEEAEWPTLALRPDVLYVLLPPAITVAKRLAAGGAACAVFEFGRVCSTNRLAIDQAIRAAILRSR